jgi:predicted amidophosphoribosyltransferase
LVPVARNGLARSRREREREMQRRKERRRERERQKEVGKGGEREKMCHLGPVVSTGSAPDASRDILQDRKEAIDILFVCRDSK